MVANELEDKDPPQADSSVWDSINQQSWVAITPTLHPKVSILGTDAASAIHQSTLADLNWAEKETQSEKEEWWEQDCAKLKQERDAEVEHQAKKERLVAQKKKEGAREWQCWCCE